MYSFSPILFALWFNEWKALGGNFWILHSFGMFPFGCFTPFYITFCILIEAVKIVHLRKLHSVLGLWQQWTEHWIIEDGGGELQSSNTMTSHRELRSSLFLETQIESICPGALPVQIWWKNIKAMFILGLTIWNSYEKSGAVSVVWLAAVIFT